ncbi:hypothetical protein SUR55_09265, partial [Streptococcus agalactiae]
IIGNPSLNHRYRKGFYSLFKTLQQNQILKDYILQSLSTDKIRFHSYYLLTDNISQISTLKPDLIITNRKLFTYVTKELATNSLVAHIDYNDTPSQISNIQTIISNIKEEKYRKIFDKI